MKVGDRVRTEIALPGIPASTRGIVTEVGRLFVVVAFEDGRHGYYARRQLTAVYSLPGGNESPTNELVLLGIAGTRVPRGSHLCLLPSSGTAAVNIIARYAAAGMNGRECTLCVVPDKWRTRFLHCLSLLRTDMDAAIHSEGLKIVSSSDFYLTPAKFAAHDQLERTATSISRTAKENPGGLRIFGCVGQTHTADGWWEYEERITPILKAFGATALCVYDHDGLPPGLEQKTTLLHTHVLRDGQLTVGGSRIF